MQELTQEQKDAAKKRGMDLIFQLAREHRIADVAALKHIIVIQEQYDSDMLRLAAYDKKMAEELAANEKEEAERKLKPEENQAT
jgi:hypothetical protein